MTNPTRRSWTQQARSTGESRAREERGGRPGDARRLADPLAPPLDVWNASRVRWIVERELNGAKVIVVANRAPRIHERNEDGSVRVLHPASGLVTALEPVVRATRGLWVAHGSGSADRENSDEGGRLMVGGEDGYTLRRLWLTAEEEQGYYYGCANEALWPLCHLAHARPLFRAGDWGHYRAVNQRFADAVCEEAGVEDPLVLVQDYHLALVPAMIRRRLPHATIVSFWHIPWPNAERFGICPWDGELLEGLLGSSIVGFHTRLHCNNFLDAVDRRLEARIDREDQAVVIAGNKTLVRPYPISIEWPSPFEAVTPPAGECGRELRAALGIEPEVRLGVGVDRLDYTKGIEERLLAVERAFERFPELRGTFTFVQVAAPSRTAIERYRQLGEAVERVTSRINQRFATDRWKPVVLLRKHHEGPEVFRIYRAANLCYVSSLHDGMNLVAKEFISARDDLRGTLVLSRFTGAARELGEALLVNPYDLEEASGAIAAALSMSEMEQAARMTALRATVSEFNVFRWAGRMLVEASRVRRREQMTDAIDRSEEG